MENWFWYFPLLSLPSPQISALAFIDPFRQCNVKGRFGEQLTMKAFMVKLRRVLLQTVTIPQVQALWFKASGLAFLLSKDHDIWKLAKCWEAVDLTHRPACLPLLAVNLLLKLNSLFAVGLLEELQVVEKMASYIILCIMEISGVGNWLWFKANWYVLWLVPLQEIPTQNSSISGWRWLKMRLREKPPPNAAHFKFDNTVFSVHILRLEGM